MLLTRSFAAFERSVASREWIKASLQAAALLWEIEQQEPAAAAPLAAGHTLAYEA